MKNQILNRIFTATLTLSLLACSSLSSKSSGSRFQLRPFEEKTLANGLRILYIPDASLPRISFHMLIQAGSAMDPRGKEGLAALTVSLLEQGSNKRKALEIADDFAQLGSAFVESASSDYVMATTTGLSQYKDQLLDLYADVILNPKFSDEEIKRRKSQVTAELTQMPDRPSEYVGVLLDRVLFGQHPYAHPVSGTIAGLRSISKKEIQQFYRENYVPGNAMIAIAGNFDNSFKATVEKKFLGWKPRQRPDFKVPVPAIEQKQDLRLFTKAGLQQTQIRIGELGIPRNHPDFLKLRLANVVLGGAFASRLNQKVRDDLGLTYSISSMIDARQSTGSFEISTFSRNEKAAETIKASMAVVREFQQSGITEKELNAAKALLIGQFPAAIETVDRLAFNLLALRVYGVPDTYLSEFFNNVDRIRLKDVNQVIRTHLQPDYLKVVVFADEKAVKTQLSDLGQVRTELVKEN